MGRGRCYYRGRWVPRSHLYDGGEEPIYIGPGRPRRRGGASGGLLGVLVLAAVGSLYGFIVYKLLTQ